MVGYIIDRSISRPEFLFTTSRRRDKLYRISLEFGIIIPARKHIVFTGDRRKVISVAGHIIFRQNRGIPLVGVQDQFLKNLGHIPRYGSRKIGHSIFTNILSPNGGIQPFEIIIMQQVGNRSINHHFFRNFDSVNVAILTFLKIDVGIVEIFHLARVTP